MQFHKLHCDFSNKANDSKSPLGRLETRTHPTTSFTNWLDLVSLVHKDLSFNSSALQAVNFVLEFHCKFIAPYLDLPRTLLRVPSETSTAYAELLPDFGA